MRILCADDNPDIGELYQKILSRGGHEVDCVYDGQTAWEMLSSGPVVYDLVFVDYQMPRLNGGEIVRRLRKIGFPGRVVVQSGFLTPEMEREFQEEFKVDRIVHKPIGFQTVTNLVAEWA